MRHLNSPAPTSTRCLSSHHATRSSTWPGWNATNHVFVIHLPPRIVATIEAYVPGPFCRSPRHLLQADPCASTPDLTVRWPGVGADTVYDAPRTLLGGDAGTL